MSSLIRQLATSHSGDLFCAAEFEKTVHIYSLKDYEKVTTLDTKLDFGGKRLAVSSDDQLCAIAAYRRYGITMYHLPDGEVLWNRKDLKKAQVLRFHPSKDILIVSITYGPTVFVDAKTGETIKVFKKHEDVWASPFEDTYLFENQKTYTITVSNGKQFIIRRDTFNIQDVSFSKDITFVSEGMGPLNAISNTTGKILWKNSIEDGQFIRIGFNEEKKVLFAVFRSSKNAEKTLYAFDGESGEIINKLKLESDATETDFAKNNSLLICSNGSIYDLSLSDYKIDCTINLPKEA